ncbi:MAG: PadR family transcriptional regulator [Solirubrobacteraceae bacterium]
MAARKANKDSPLDGKSPVLIAVLAAVIEKPGHGWDVARRAKRRLGPSWPVESKNIYGYVERLERDGLIRSQTEPSDGQYPKLKVYYATEEGEEARRRWRMTPLEQAVITTDLDVRLTFSDEEDIPELLDRLGERYERVLEEIEEIEITEASHVSDRHRARVINMHRSSVEMRLRAELEWLERTKQELEAERDQRSPR